MTDKKKKIGIITYHCSNNYGAQLQAYALSHFLQNEGYDAEVLDCNTIGKGPIFHWSFASLRAVLGSIRNNLLSLVSERKRHRSFEMFASQMIKLSEPCHTKSLLDSLAPKYDYVITGSDQVWHPEICEGKTCFFLDLPIPDEKKIAYAPSFGVSEYTPEEELRYMPLIEKIAHLSVREETGRNMIKKAIGRDVVIVSDPTMLLPMTEWDSIALEPKYKKYLFYFTILDEPKGTDEMVRRIAKEKQMQVVRIGTVRDIVKRGFINARASGPQEFLGLIKNADFIVTSSFHGAVFSILYEKQFICVLNDNDRNSRMENLLTNLGIGGNAVMDVNSFDINVVPVVDYLLVNNKLNELREKSISFLKSAIGENET